MMKPVLFFILFTWITNPAFARPLDTKVKAEAVEAIVRTEVSQIPGVEYTFVGPCDPKTGRVTTVRRRFVHCVVVYTFSSHTQQAVEDIYPPGEKVDGVYVSVDRYDLVRAKPRMSGGN